MCFPVVERRDSLSKHQKARRRRNIKRKLRRVVWLWWELLDWEGKRELELAQGGLQGTQQQEEQEQKLI